MNVSPEIYRWSATFHVLSAIVWVGAMAFIGLVLGPELRKLDDPGLRTRLYHRVGLRLRWIGWISIGILLLTGPLMLAYRGFTWDRFWSSSFLSSRLGILLLIKLTAVLAILILSALHDFAYGPRLNDLPPGGPEWIRLRRRIARIGRLNALLALVVVVLAVRLFR